jgi:hypothetical protein
VRFSFRDVNLLALGIFLAFWIQFFFDYATADKGSVPTLMEAAEVTMLLFAGAWLVINVFYEVTAPKSRIPE